MIKKFSTEIQKLRKEKNYSQEKLAEILNISRQSIAKWESGESLPELQKLLQISQTFNLSLDSLLIEEKPCESINIKSIDREFLDLKEFICRAKKKTYAGKGFNIKSSRPGSHDLEYTEGDMYYLDTYLGGEKFTGEEAVWFNLKPIWSMNYSGRVLDSSFSGDFLKDCLLNVTVEYPYRGPELYSSGDYTYHNKYKGSLEWFNGTEEIYFKGDKIYECIYHGGRVK